MATRLDILREAVLQIFNGYSYQLNLVLENGSRINAVYGGDLDHLRKDAKRLAEFLKVPLWDAT